jgi:hypothetical protein
VLDQSLFEQFMAQAKEPGNQELRETHGIPEWVYAQAAMLLAVTEIIEEHCKTGHPLIGWRDGKIYHQPPEEARHEVEEALKSEPLASIVRDAQAGRLRRA